MTLSNFEGSKKGPVRIELSSYDERSGRKGQMTMTVEEAFIAIRGLQLGMIGGDGYDGNGWKYTIKKIYLYDLETTTDAIVSLFLQKLERRR